MPQNKHISDRQRLLWNVKNVNIRDIQSCTISHGKIIVGESDSGACVYIASFLRCCNSPFHIKH